MSSTIMRNIMNLLEGSSNKKTSLTESILYEGLEELVTDPNGFLSKQSPEKLITTKKNIMRAKENGTLPALIKQLSPGIPKTDIPGVIDNIMQALEDMDWLGKTTDSRNQHKKAVDIFKTKTKPGDIYSISELVNMIIHIVAHQESPRIGAAGVIRDLTTQGYFLGPDDGMPRGQYKRTTKMDEPVQIGFNKRREIEPVLKAQAKNDVRSARSAGIHL